MAFRHGVYKSEVPTSVAAPSQIDAGLPVVFGTAPVYMGDKSNVNKPVLCYTYEEAVAAMGYSTDWESWTLCEYIYSQFALYGNAPCVVVNVWDPSNSRHVKEESGGTYVSTAGTVNLGPGVISADDYELNYDDDGNALITIESGKSIAIEKILKANPSGVTSNDIIGGVKVSTGESAGLEIVNDIFPKFGLVPGIILAPGWSQDSGVAAVMLGKAENISGIFTGISVVDILTPQVYGDVSSAKNTLNIVDEHQVACWPMVKLSDKTFHLSTQLACLMNKTDREHADVPYKSPGNETLQMDSAVTSNGTEVLLTLEQANYLNSQGIVTALNWVGGWRAWGNRTAAYPANTDAKDAFIPVRRMFDYLSNTFILTFWQKVDEPMTPRLVRTIVNTFNIYLNSLVAREMLLGGRIEFREDENAYTDLLNGILKFHVFITPPIPAEAIEGIFEYDVDYLSVLYDALK